MNICSPFTISDENLRHLLPVCVIHHGICFHKCFAIRQQDRLFRALVISPSHHVRLRYAEQLRQLRNNFRRYVRDNFRFITSMSFPYCFHRPIFILPFHPDQFNNIQQVVQGIGSVPKFMLFPESHGDRQKRELIQVRAGCWDEVTSAGRELDPTSEKKPCSVQMASSKVNFRQVAVSCSSSAQLQEDPCIMGW